MIRFRLRYVVLYTTGIALLVFGNRGLWERLQEENRQAETNRKLAEQARILSSRPFEVQALTRDPVTNALKNNHPYIQTVHVGRVNFKALRPKLGGASVETNDDENASDTF